MRITVILIFVTQLLTSCSNPPERNQYYNELNNWKAKRLQDLKAPDGWLSLSGLFWLQEGESTFGSDSSNKIIFPSKAPSFMGAVFLEEDSLWTIIRNDIHVSLRDSLITHCTLNSDMSGDPTILWHNSLNWRVIQRGDKYGIRLRDSANVKIQLFEGINYFPADEKWIVPSQFIQYDTSKTITFKNVLGMEIEMTLEGKLSFTKNDKAYELDVLDGGENYYFLIFSDETTGLETYGGGRYLYVAKADKEWKTMIDFNKAINPPCAFTDFATCLLPPPQNRLDFPVFAGEKFEGH
ncbi:MAG: DUF1684 domain-containing protein [Bacteroidetes bacterium]|nr:DUF1684 domain-containing protein [Bacteroidota bacterium]